MPHTIKDIYNWIDTEVAPFSRKEVWDNSGLLVGDLAQRVTGVGLVLDITPDAIATAKQLGLQLLVSHHPVIFHPLSSLSAQNPVYLLAQAGICAISAHTNYDSAHGGVNDALAERLGLQDSTPAAIPSMEATILRIGNLPQPMPADAFAAHVQACLGSPVRYARVGSKTIRTVAVLGGAGGEYASEVAALGADAFVTGEAPHHEFIQAVKTGLCLVEAGHFETENPSIAPLAQRMQNAFPSLTIRRIEQENPVMHTV